jgi:hypothetical protein
LNHIKPHAQVLGRQSNAKASRSKRTNKYNASNLSGIQQNDRFLIRIAPTKECPSSKIIVLKTKKNNGVEAF